MSENNEDLAARIERLEDSVHNLKTLVRRLNRKWAHITQPRGLARMVGLDDLMSEIDTEAIGDLRSELAEEIELDLEEEVDLDFEMETELETVDEVEFEFEEEYELELEEEFKFDFVEEPTLGDDADDE